MEKIWKQPFDLDWLNKMTANNMGEHFDLQFTAIGPDYLEASIPVDHRTIQPYGYLHGGANVALAETLGSVASALCLTAESGKGAVGVEVNANHLRPVTKGRVTGRVKPVKLGKSIQVWNIEIYDERQRLTCVSRLTTAVIDIPK